MSRARDEKTLKNKIEINGTARQTNLVMLANTVIIIMQYLLHMLHCHSQRDGFLLEDFTFLGVFAFCCESKE